MSKFLVPGTTACLDAYGKAFIILPIGTTSLSIGDTEISYFRHLAIQYAKQFPIICIVTNPNMIRHERAIPHMIVKDDDPHYSDRGRQQMVSNLLYFIKQAQPALCEYADIVNNHFEKSQPDPDRPSPKARLYRRSPKHTGIPETPSTLGKSTSTVASSAGSLASTRGKPVYILWR